MSVKSQREIDCTKKRIRLLALTACSCNMGSGEGGVYLLQLQRSGESS
ncbi:MAG: surface-adhesin E family protein [Nitrospira sp.]